MYLCSYVQDRQRHEKDTPPSQWLGGALFPGMCHALHHGVDAQGTCDSSQYGGKHLNDGFPSGGHVRVLS